MEKRNEFYVVTEVWDMELSTRAQTVYMYLSYCANKYGDCFPSMGRIAKECGMCENTARKMITELVQKGFITSRPRVLKTENGNRQTTNVYHLLTERGPRKRVPRKNGADRQAGEEPELLKEKNGIQEKEEPEAQAKEKPEAIDAQNAKEDDASGLRALLDRLGVRKRYEDKYAGKAVELAITELWFAERTKICGEQVPRYRMRMRLNELDTDAIDDVMFAMGEGNVENNAAYIKSCVYNAPMRANARIAVQVAEVRREAWERDRWNERKKYEKEIEENIRSMMCKN